MKRVEFWVDCENAQLEFVKSEIGRLLQTIGVSHMVVYVCDLVPEGT